MIIEDTDKDIPIWLVWGWSIKSGEMSLLNIALNYKHAKYTYEVEKDNENYLRVWIEPTKGNHSFSGRVLYPAQGIDMLKEDKENYWQDKFGRVRLFCSSLIRNFDNKEKFIKLANRFKAEFGMIQNEIDLYKYDNPNN